MIDTSRIATSRVSITRAKFLSLIANGHFGALVGLRPQVSGDRRAVAIWRRTRTAGVANPVGAFAGQ
ncbi:hypothetical protein OG226_01820 [Streptomyces sp. NBC_01261]|uniref:hypothetical protein n=1 Tax=Streptomyces sp. NBC_01261 TaxID=2903802 RepID=UPI002E307116|nr:hypothetical protein [Streptomyces sp. NBC_01261]